MKRQTWAVWVAALVVPFGILIPIAYYLRTKPWFREDHKP